MLISDIIMYLCFRYENNQTNSHIMTHSDFNYGIVGNVLWIKDNNLGNMSVTNDMENVLEHLDKQLDYALSNNRYLIVYCDSEGTWDGIYYHEKMADFIIMNETSLESAINRIKTINTI